MKTFPSGKILTLIIKKLLVFPGVFFLLFSCENDIEKIKSLTDPSEFPDVYAQKVEIIYTDSAELQVILEASSIKRFGDVERPYIEFPEGLYVRFFDDSLRVESEISANYAIYYNEEQLWEAKGNVVANNIGKGEKLNTEELFWDETEKMIYSNSFSRIETEDGTFYGQDGFEANQRFTKWRLKGSRGTVNIKEADEENETPEN
ncbi:MAG: LPS export ABC transporter periplasmic protein LptC [Bacteroidota bacterium]